MERAARKSLEMETDILKSQVEKLTKELHAVKKTLKSPGSGLKIDPATKPAQQDQGSPRIGSEIEHVYLGKQRNLPGGSM